MTDRLIKDIRRWAKDIAGDNEQAQRMKIVAWSAFKSGEDGRQVYMQDRDLDKISEGWLRVIHSKAKRAYDAWLRKNSNLSLFPDGARS